MSSLALSLEVMCICRKHAQQRNASLRVLRRFVSSSSSSSLVVFRGVDDFFFINNAEKLFFRIDTAALSVRPASFRHHHEARKNAEKKKNHNRTTDRPSKGEQRSFFALRFMEFLRSC